MCLGRNLPAFPFVSYLLQCSQSWLLTLCCVFCIPACHPGALQKHSSEWKPEIRLPSGSDHVMLKSLDWNAEYEVYVIAENQQGKSKPAHYAFRTSPQPTVIPGTAVISFTIVFCFQLMQQCCIL